MWTRPPAAANVANPSIAKCEWPITQSEKFDPDGGFIQYASARQLDRQAQQEQLIGLILRGAQPAQEVIAADAKEDEAWGILVERGRQSLERLRGDFAGDTGAHYAPPDQALELRWIAFVLVRPGAIGQAVTEGEDHRVGGQTLELGAAACREKESERCDEETGRRHCRL